MPIEAFISYCHSDERFRKELDTHLALLQRQGLVTTWHDRMISPGDNWAVRINHALDRCHLVLLLVSADFVRSDYCWGVEMTRAIARHDAGTAVVVPIAVRRCDWSGAPFARLQALPKDAKPVADWPKRDHAWTDVALGIRKLVDPEPCASAPVPPPPASVHHGSPSPRAATPSRSPWDTFLDTVARESGTVLGREGMMGLISSIVGSDDPPKPSLTEVVAELLAYADHARLGEILRDHHLSAPRSRSDRARLVAESFQWDAALVADAFTLAQIKELASALKVPKGTKAAMAAGIVKAVNGMTE